MNNGFTVKRLKSAETLGEKLCKIRKKAGLSLDKLSNDLRIQKKYLESLEKSFYCDLPADVYIRGFIRSYADYFNLDCDKLLKIYEEEKGIQERIKKIQTKNVLKPLNSSLIITPRIVRIFAVALVVFACLFYLWYQIDSLAAAPELVVLEPAADKTIDNDDIVIKGKTQPEAILSINGEETYVDKEGGFEEEIGLQEGMNILEIIAKNKIGKESKITRRIWVELPRQIISSKDDESFRQKIELKITIKSDPVWIQVVEDGKNVFSGMVLPDVSKTFKANEKIVLSSSRPKDTYIVFNGEDLGILKDTEETVKDIEFKR